MKTVKKTTALLLAFIIAFSCFAVAAVAAPKITGVKIVQAPLKTTYFKGRDWDYGYWKFSDGTGVGTFTSNSKYIAFKYNGGYYSNYSDLGMMDLNGLIVEVTYSDGKKERIAYKETKSGNEIGQNIYWSPSTKLKAGSNGVDIYFKQNVDAYDTYTVTLSEKAALRGDVNEDLNVNSADALIVLQHVVGMKTLAGTWFKTADLDSSNSLNSADALSILRIAVGQDK